MISIGAVFYLLVLFGVGFLSCAIGMSLALSDVTGRPRREPTWPMTRCRRIALAGFVLAIGAAVLVLVVPMGGSSTVSSSSASDGTVTTATSTTSSVRLIDQEGASVLVLLAVPVILTAVGAFVRGRWERSVRRTCGWMLVVLAVVAVTSLGLFFLPAAIATTVAGACTPRIRRYGRIAERDQAAFTA